MLTIMLMGMFDLLCLAAWLILAGRALTQMDKPLGIRVADFLGMSALVFMVLGLVNALAGFLVTPDVPGCWDSMDCHAQQGLLKLHEARWGALVAAMAGGWVFGFWLFRSANAEYETVKGS